MLTVTRLQEQLRPVRRAVESAAGLPNVLYNDPAGFELEKQQIFHRTWACIGVANDVPEPGDAKPIDFLGMPLLLVRDHDGALRLFQNVCRHRGMILIDAPRKLKGVIRCPYHSWCYNLNGSLRATPHVGGPGINEHCDVPADQLGLLEVRMGVFLDAVFADVSGHAAPFEEFIAPLKARWSEFADQPLYHGGQESRFTLDIASNWKLAVENYCESYHLPWVHPGLNSYSRLEDHYNIFAPDDAAHAPGDFSGQGTLVYAPQFEGEAPMPNFGGLSDVWDRSAEYIALFPNVLFGVHRDHVYSIRLEPVSHGRTREHIEIYYTTPEAATSDERASTRRKNAALWKDIFIEDIGVVEGMQQGRGALGFDGGKFSPVMDAPTHRFHAWVAAQLS
ncbi:MAG: aromatic ring-hydroxylating dioxygenase subunit alpha [Pseudomonadota bacterium]